MYHSNNCSFYRTGGCSCGYKKALETTRKDFEEILKYVGQNG